MLIIKLERTEFVKRGKEDLGKVGQTWLGSKKIGRS